MSLIDHLQTSKPVLVKPVDLVIGRPEFASLVDINFAGLLRIRLAEALASLECSDAGFKDAALAAEICSTGKTESRGEVHFGWVKESAVRILAEVKHLTLPVRLQSLCVASQSPDWRGIVLE